VIAALLAAVVGLTVATDVDSVVVYPNQVLVVRKGAANASGPGELLFEGLPGALDDKSVRIKAPGLRIGEVQVKRGYIDEPTPEVRRLQLRVQMLEDSLKALDDEGAVLKAREEFLGSVKLGAPEIIAKDLQQGRVAPEAWRGALAFLSEELARVKARQLRLGRERPELEKRVNAARQEYNAARGLIENRKQVRVEFAAEPGSYDVRLVYVISNVTRAAEWQPYYELRAKPGEGKVELAYFAKLGQRTGEDWERVKVVLSTATPVFDVAAPEPYPWYLTLVEEHRAERSRAMPAPGAMAAEAFDEVSVTAKLAEAPLEPVETGISLQYAIPGRVSLKSGEPTKKLQLTQFELGAEFSYYTFPKAGERAYLKGRLVNSSKFVLLPGNGNTYVGEEFTGGVFVPAVAQEESLGMSFGADERVRVKRELVRSFKSRAGVLGRVERQQFVYRTTVENFRQQPMTIEVVEQVPVSQQKEIKVTVVRAEPKPEEQDDAKGTRTWKPELKPGEKFVIDLEFQVEYPTGRRVSGLF